MQACSENHQEIRWNYGPCPLCALMEQHEALAKKIGQFIGEIEEERQERARRDAA